MIQVTKTKFVAVKISENKIRYSETVKKVKL